MCPPASTPQVAELGEYWTDEEVFKSLLQFKSGCSLPSNVTSDVDPYRCRPSNLSEDMWYFCSGAKEVVENGFWLSTGEACEIFSDYAIIGLRKTLQFYEGQAPHGQKTNWMMQEYTTTEKYSCKPVWLENMQDPRALCRVFLTDESRLVHPELPSGHRIADIDVTSLVHPELPSRHHIADIDVTSSINPGPNIVSDDKHSSGQLTKSELLEKNMDDGTGPSAMANRSSDLPLENFPDIDYVSRGDYLELDDLADPLSHSSSSADSSCMTMTSEDFFDSDDLMCKLGDGSVDQEIQDSRMKFNLSTPAKSKEVVMHPTNLGSVDSGEECKPSTGQTSKMDHTPQNEPGVHRNECTSNGVNTTTSSSSSEGSEKKDRVGRTKKRKVMKYLCFMSF